MSFHSVFGMQNVTLCMRTWYEVRNFASQKFRLTPAQPVLPTGIYKNQIWKFWYIFKVLCV